MGKRKKRKNALDKQRKLESIVLKTYYDFSSLEVTVNCKDCKKLRVYR